MTSKEYVLSIYPQAHHGLGQYAYIRGFEDSSDYVHSGVLGGEYLSQDQNGEDRAWDAAASRVRSQQPDRKKVFIK